MKNSFLFAVCAMQGLVAFAGPYAFTYGGRTVTGLDTAPVVSTVEDGAGRFTRTVLEWTSPDGKLLLRSTETEYRDHPVREYVPELVCVGDAPTEIVDGFRSFVLSRATASATVRALRGTVNTDRDFEAVTVRLGPGATNRFEQVNTEGRSSAQWMPWTGIDFDDGSGVEVAIGWSGAWRGDFALEQGRLTASAGMVRTHFRLLPGETIRQPSVLVFTRGKDVSPRAFQTVIHRFMVDVKSPRDAKGALLKPILPITCGGGSKTPEMMRKVIDWSKANGMPFDTFWVDAGWNGPAHSPDPVINCGGMWYNFTGDWRFNPTVHPDGNLGAIADHAHAAGLRMLLWLEPERCVSDPPPPVFREHREWLLPKDDAKVGKGRLAGVRALNVNLGDEAAWSWVLETVSEHVRASKLDIYRQDFNMCPLPLWQDNDAPDRQGVTEAKYIAGLYRFWDALRARFPHLIIENCASGGRRLDFEAVSRAHSYCRTDYAIFHRGPSQIVDMQRTLLNTLPYLPFQGSETTPARLYDDYGFVSSIGAGTVFTPSDWNAGIVRNDFTVDETAWFRKMFTLADRMRPYFSGEFHPLTSDRDAVPPEAEPNWYRGSEDERRWCAWQLDLAKEGRGLAIAFRRLDTPSPVFTAELGGIDEKAIYEVETWGGGRETVSGATLRNWRVELRSPRTFRLVFYRRVACR